MEIKGLVWVGTATERYDATVAFFREMLGLSVFHQSPALTVLIWTGVLLLVATASYRLVEQPAIELGRRLTTDHRPPTTGHRG